MADLVEYVSLYDPDFATRISGADEDEIETLEVLVGQPLPEQYKQFLSLLGHSNDEFTLAYYGSTDIGEIIEYYADFRAGEVGPPPLNCVVIGYGDISVGNICLQFQDTQEPKVIFAVGKKVLGIYAGSLEKLLFRKAFIRHRLKIMPYSGVYISNDSNPLFKAASEIALRSGFTQRWFSDDAAFCGEREGAGIFIEQYQGRGIWIRICGGSQGEVKKIGDAFQRELGVEFSHWVY
jgi:hypothetical protein